jgi:hypothetical protein
MMILGCEVGRVGALGPGVLGIVFSREILMEIWFMSRNAFIVTHSNIWRSATRMVHLLPFLSSSVH